MSEDSLTYWYRLFLTTWGIAIKFTYRVGLETDSTEQPTVKYGGVAIFADPRTVRLPEDLHILMVDGAERLYCRFPEYFAKEQRIHIEQVEFAATDFQDEALPYAFAELLAFVLEIPYERPKVIFDKTIKRYLYLEFIGRQRLLAKE